MDKSVPGTYHKGEHIRSLSISTEVFISFPKITDMLRSFFVMVDRVSELFFKGINMELNQNEIFEYNFLVTWLHAQDITMPSVLVTYDNLCLYRKAYVEEDFNNIFSYIKIKSLIGTDPWRCKEFFNDMNLVQKFVNIFPETKAEMRKFSMEVSKFLCTFIWSDAEPIRFSDEEEAEMSAFNEMLGVEDVPIEERALTPTHVYVPKTKAEMFDWEEYASRLKKAASPAKLGGLEVPEKEWEFNQLEAISRIKRRIDAKMGGKL